MEAVQDTVNDTVSNVKQGMGNALTGGMAFMRKAKTDAMEKVEEMGEEAKGAGDEMMKHVPLKGAIEDMGNEVQDLMAEKLKDVDQMADDLMAETEEMVHEVGANVDEAMSMVGLPKVSNSSDGDGAVEMLEGADAGDGKISSKTPIQSMDSFKTGSPEPELQKLEEMSSTESPKPSSNILEMVDLDAPTPTPTSTMMMAE